MHSFNTFVRLENCVLVSNTERQHTICLFTRTLWGVGNKFYLCYLKHLFAGLTVLSHLGLSLLLAYFPEDLLHGGEE